MDAEINERDVELLLLGEEGWVRLGAMLSLHYRMLESRRPQDVLRPCPIQGA